MTSKKSYAMINGVMQEYDVCTTLLPTPFIIDESLYEKIGVGTVEEVSGVKNFGGKEMEFYRLKNPKKKV